MISLRSFFSFQVINQLLFPYKYGIPFKYSDLYRGFKLYIHTSSIRKKNIFQVLLDLSKLTRYWKAFPDTYFRFGMFLKDFTDLDRMISFVPQGSYNRISMDKLLKYHVLIDDKIIFHDLMSQYGLPVPVRYFTFRKGVFRNGNKLMSDSDVNSIISSVMDDRIFCKKFTGGAASGVSIFIKKDGVYIDVDNDFVSAAMIRKKYKGEDLFFEKQLIQEPVLKQFNPDSVNTIRVLTFHNKVISATVRFGSKGSYVDNTAKGGVAVSLDIETGKLQSYGMREYDLTHYTEHPDSHLKFENTFVTQWPQVKSLVERTLKYFPYYKSVGFDIATTNEGPVIIEINTGAGIYLSQMGKNRGLKDYFDNLPLNNDTK